MPIHLNTLIHRLRGGSTSTSEEAGFLSRRSFLAGMAIAGCSKALASGPLDSTSLLASDARDESWALLSDVHISADLDRTWGFSCMAAHLQTVLNRVQAMRPEHVLINGDVAFTRGEVEDYRAFADMIRPLRDKQIPLHLTLGNHDRRERFTSALPVEDDGSVNAKVMSSRRIGNHQWIFLDSLEKTQKTRGSLGQDQLAWLKRRLEGDKSPTLICLHHNPDRSAVGLKDYEEFQDIVLPRRQVKLVVFGHTHLFRTWQTDGLHFVNLPAVGFRLRPGTSLGWMSGRFKSGGADLAFHGVSRRDRDDGAVRRLRWRTDA